MREDLNAAMKEAMRDRDSVRLSTLRLVNAAVKDRDIAARAGDRCGGIGDAEIISLLAKMVKQREESAKIYEDNGRAELAERERTEIGVMRAFMPEPLPDDELKAAIRAFIEEFDATCLKDMGRIMERIKSDYAGRVDMAKAGRLVKDYLCGQSA